MFLLVRNDYSAALDLCANCSGRFFIKINVTEGEHTTKCEEPDILNRQTRLHTYSGVSRMTDIAKSMI
jgi:hypothetical protein